MKLEIAQKILEKNKQDYNKLAKEFSNKRDHLWPELQKLVRYVEDGNRILDLGCGNGRLVELFKDKQVEYVGIDQSEKLIEIARKRFLKLGIKNYELRVGDALNLPFKDNEFDAIFAVALLHHIPSKKLRLKVLENCYRVLKPGGFLILTVWNLWQPKLILKYKTWPMLLGWRLPSLDWKDVFIPWHDQAGTVYRYYHAFCKNELKRLIEKSGFSSAKGEPDEQGFASNGQIEDYYSRKGQKTNWLKGFNLVVIAKKPKK